MGVWGFKVLGFRVWGFRVHRVFLRVLHSLALERLELRLCTRFIRVWWGMYGCLVLLLGSCSRFTDPNRTTKAKPHQHKTIDPEPEQNTKGNDIHYTSRTKLKPMTSSKQTRRSFKPQPVMNFPPFGLPLHSPRGPKNNPLHTEALQHSKH